MKENGQDRRALTILSADLFRNLLENSDSPSRLGRDLTLLLRELIGGRTVLLLEYDNSECGYRMVGVCPTRKMGIVQEPFFREWMKTWRTCVKPETFQVEGVDSEEETLFHNAMIIPLRTSAEAVGMLLFLDLMDLTNISDVVSLLSELSTFIAVVLVNGRTYAQQEQMLQSRTVELRQTIDLLREAKEEAEQARIRAEAANAAKSRFLANMSHELRTPMNGIMGITSLLKETEQDKEQQEFLALIEKSGNSLLHMISNLLGMANLDGGQEMLRMETIVLPKLLRGLVEEYLIAARHKKIDLTIHLTDSIPTVIQGDAEKWREVIRNLLDNAVKFTTSGNVVLRAFGTSSGNGSCDMVVVEVHDTGIGISQEDLPGVFNDFSQLDDSMTKRYQGAGLGLAVVQRFVEMMGGWIHVESIPGEGSCFTVKLPVRVLE